MLTCRNDPALAAAELSLAIEKAALGTGASIYSCKMCCSVLAAEQVFNVRSAWSKTSILLTMSPGRVQSVAEPFTMVTTGATETVATVGLWEQEPNIYNAIPRKVLPPPALW